MNKRLLLNYKRSGEKVLSIQDYYTNIVSPKANKFSRYSFERSNTVVCPFHDDNDPSLGVIHGKDGIDRYHCFGCRAVGDFIDFYQGIEKIFNNRIITEEQAISEIAKRYEIPLNELEVDLGKVELSREQQLNSLKHIYTVADFERDVRKGLLMERPVAYYNAKLLELISEEVG